MLHNLGVGGLQYNPCSACPGYWPSPGKKRKYNFSQNPEYSPGIPRVYPGIPRVYPGYTRGILGYTRAYRVYPGYTRVYPVYPGYSPGIPGYTRGIYLGYTRGIHGVYTQVYPGYTRVPGQALIGLLAKPWEKAKKKSANKNPGYTR